MAISIREFVKTHYRHFNAAALADAAEAYVQHLERGGKMLMTLAGAMSTAELGLSLAEIIRQRKVHAICCTGANLEEDLFNLVAHKHYRRVPHYRNLTREQEKELEHQGLNRVTDTCIPEEKAFRVIERPLVELWGRAAKNSERFFPYEYLYQLIREGWVKEQYQIDPKDSWLVAASELDLPLFVPGWEDSTLGNVFVSNVLRGNVGSLHVVKSGLETMVQLADWYTLETMGKPVLEIESVGGAGEHDDVTLRAIPAEQAKNAVGFFQIGGGIAGDFPICVVPMIHQDMRRPCPYWAYFCQISDSTTSYGSYSGAIPTEKITWGKLDISTPMFVIESDATIVAPLIFHYVLGW